jgi:hypothetical protein
MKFVRSKSKGDPWVHFEVTGWVPVKISSPNFYWLYNRLIWHLLQSKTTKGLCNVYDYYSTAVCMLLTPPRSEMVFQKKEWGLEL